MESKYSNSMLEAYLDEALPVDTMATLESAIRMDDELRKRLADIIGMRDAGLHSLGGIWRRHRLTCPTREALGSFLLGAVLAEEQDYIQFHLETVGCRFCRANLEDLQSLDATHQAEPSEQRRKRYFQSSAGYLKKEA